MAHKEEWSSDYDSTWEDDEVSAPRTSTGVLKGSKPAKDLKRYRRGYPGSPQAQTNADNLANFSFYRNKTPYQPNGLLIDQLFEKLKEGYGMLEVHYNCMQWLFPLREPGMNPSAKVLTLQEIEAMKADKEVMQRFLKAYKLLLGVYGIQLLDEKTGKVARADNWEERFRNLNSHRHNYLRLSRILKCLGELGYGHFQAPLARFLLEETLCNNTLPNVKRSTLDYFMFTVKDKSERRKLVHFAWMNYKPQEEFIWGPEERLRILLEDGSEGDIKEPYREDYDYDIKEPCREDYDNDLEEPGRIKGEDDSKEPGREDK